MVWVAAGLGFLALFIKFPRQIGTLLLLAGLAVVGLFVYKHAQDQQRDAENAAVRFSIIYDDNRCPPDFPLSITAENGARRTLDRISFRLEGYRQGYSSAVYRGWEDYSSDKILAPGSSWTSCWRVPPAYASATVVQQNPPPSILWRASSVSAIFQR